MLAKWDKEFEEEEDDDESTPIVGSPRQIELGDSSKQAKLEVGAGDVAGDAVAKKIVKPVMSQEDITKD